MQQLWIKISLLMCCMAFGTEALAQSSTQNTANVFSANGLTLADVFKVTLASNYDIHVQQQQLKVQQANVLATQSPFDLGFVAQSSAGFQPSFAEIATKSSTPSVADLQNGIWSSSIGVSKLLKSGMRITPTFDFYHNNFITQDRSSTISSNFGVSVVQPLMRGRGTNMATANLEAQTATLKAQEHGIGKTKSQVLYQAFASYWQLVAAYKNVVILREAEARALKLYQQSDTLVQRKELPASNLDQLIANYSAQKANRIASEAQYLETKMQLGITMGLEGEQIDAIPRPSADFPARLTIDNASANSTRTQLMEQSTTQRADLKYYENLIEAESIMLKANRSELRPQLDMQVDMSVKGYNAGRNVLAYLPPVGQNSAQASQFMVSFNYKIPFQNREAQSAVLRQEALVLQQNLQRQSMERAIKGEISNAFVMMRSAIAENQSVSDSKEAFERAIRNEQMKFKLGMATLVDVLTVEQNYTNAKLNQVQAQLKYTLALLRLHYETGTLYHENIDLTEHLKKLEKLPNSSSD